MKNITVLLFFLAVNLPFLSAQEQPSVSVPDNIYKHYVGKIGSNINVCFNLIHQKSKLSGNYFYYGDNSAENVQTVLMKRSKTFALKGYIVAGTLTISEPLSSGAIFTGRFVSPKRIEGFWKPNGSDVLLPFFLEESYKAGSIPFELIHLERVARLTDETFTPTAKVDLTLLVPQLAPEASQAVVDSVRHFLFSNFFETDLQAAGSPQSGLRQMVKTFFEQYRSKCEIPYSKIQKRAEFMWEKRKSCSVEFNDNQLISVGVSSYAFSGGVNSISVKKYMLFDAKSGSQIHPESIFIEGSNAALSELLEAELRRVYDISPSADLSDEGFYNDTISPNRNIYINSHGIGFCYNLFEIAGFNMGITNLYLSREQLMPFLRKEGVVYQMFSDY